MTTAVTWTSANTSVATISNLPGTNGLATGVATGTNIVISAALGSVGGSTTLTIGQPLSSFSNLSASQSIGFGTPSISLSGKLTAGATGSITITIGTTTSSAPINPDGTFTTTFNTSSFAFQATPYVITYAYAGDGNFSAVTSAATTLTVSQSQSSFSSIVASQTISYGIPSINLSGKITAGAPWFRDDSRSARQQCPPQSTLTARSRRCSTRIQACPSRPRPTRLHTLIQVEPAFPPRPRRRRRSRFTRRRPSQRLPHRISQTSFNQLPTFTAVVRETLPGTAIPTGKVTFTDGSIFLGTLPLINGVATLTPATLSLGTRSITAVYNNDTNNQTSTSTMASVVITSSPLPLTPSATQFGSHNPDVQSAEVEGVYHLVLNRPADSAGLANAVKSLNNGGTVGQLAAALLSSREYFQDVVASVLSRKFSGPGRVGDGHITNGANALVNGESTLQLEAGLSRESRVL